MVFLKERIKKIITKKQKLFLKRMYYAGHWVYCPICRGHFRKFIPLFGRENAMCPICGSMERHRLVWLYLQNETDFFTKKTVRLFQLSPEDTFKDIFSTLPNVTYVTGNLLYKNADITLDATNLPLKDNFFDIVLCCHVLEHIVDDQKAMKEFFRVLKQGGYALLQHPIHFNRERTFEDFSVTTRGERKRVFGQADHVRIYGKDMIERLVQAGFTVEDCHYPKCFDEDERNRYGLKDDEHILICHK